MTQALQFAHLRELYLKVMWESTAPAVLALMHATWPTSIDQPGEGGDQGYVMFTDGSEILFDWDNGHFECEGVQFTYPWDKTDPIFNPPPDFKWRWVFEGSIEWNSEDGGTTLADAGDMDEMDAADKYKGLVCHLTSTDPDSQHTEARPIDGRRVRITVEVLPNPPTT